MLNGLFLAVFLTAGAATADGQPAAGPSAPTAEQRITIPFNPPLGRPIGYRMTRHSSTQASPDPITLGLTLTFERRGTGYTLTVVTTPPPGTPDHPMLAILREPMTFEVTADGEVTGIFEEDAWWRRADTLLRSYVEMMRGGARGQAAMEQVVARMRAMPAEERARMFARNVAPLMEFAMSEGVVGERVSFELSGETVLGTSVVQPWERILERAGPTEVEYRSRLMFSAEMLTGMTAQMMAAVGGNGQRPSREAGASAREERRYVVMRESGLTRHYSARTTLILVGGSERVIDRWDIEAED